MATTASIRKARITMGMPAIVEIVGASVRPEDPAHGRASCEAVFAFWDAVDTRFSTYKEDSEISRINRGEVQEDAYSADMREIFALAEKTKRETAGFFDIQRPDGSLDPSGVVKGWAIARAAELLAARGYENFYVEIAGDIQTRGVNPEGQPWSIGVRNPFNHDEIVKVLYLRGAGVATSGTAARGAHIYNPLAPTTALDEIISLTVIGPDILEADRYATAAFAMGKHGIEFIEQMPGFEGYEINRERVARRTSGFARYCVLP